MPARPPRLIFRGPTAQELRNQEMRIRFEQVPVVALNAEEMRIRRDLEALAAQNRANTLGGSYTNANARTTVSQADLVRQIEQVTTWDQPSTPSTTEDFWDLARYYSRQRPTINPFTINPLPRAPRAPRAFTPPETPMSIFNRAPARMRFFALCEANTMHDPWSDKALSIAHRNLKVRYVIVVGPGGHVAESTVLNTTLDLVTPENPLLPQRLAFASSSASRAWRCGFSKSIENVDNYYPITAADNYYPITAADKANTSNDGVFMRSLRLAFDSWHVRELSPDQLHDVRTLRRLALSAVRFRVSTPPSGPGVNSANSQREWRDADGAHIYQPTIRQALAEQIRLFLADVRAGHDTAYKQAMYGKADIDAIHSAFLSVGIHRASAALSRINESLSRAGFCEQFAQFDCGHWGWDDDGHDVGGGRFDRNTVCGACYEDYVVCEDDNTMQRPGRLYLWDDDTYHYNEQYPDDDDYDSSQPDSLMAYDTNVLRFLNIDPSFKTSAYGDFHMGVELETICYDDSPSSKVRAVRRELGTDYVVGKRDGSLDDGGIEWVTRPTSLTTHLAKLGNWTDTARGLKAWQPGCCGMHVHIDSRAFTALTLGKFLQFFNNRSNVDFIRQIAGRHPARDEQARGYAKWDLSESNVGDPSTAVKAKGGNQQRYTMVNTTNLGYRESERLGMENQGGDANTVEVRIYRASMRKERMLAQLEFTHALVMFCRVAGYRAMTGDAFLTWLRKNAGQYRNLSKWYGINNKHGNPKQGMPAPASTVEPELA